MFKAHARPAGVNQVSLIAVAENKRRPDPLSAQRNRVEPTDSRNMAPLGLKVGVWTVRTGGFVQCEELNVALSSPADPHRLHVSQS